MRGRARHLTGRAAGADLFFDARRIQGLSDGTGVQTWDDLSTNANNATQATSGSRPTYKVNIQGGSPLLYFDGGDYIECGAAATVGSSYSVVGIAKTNNTTPAHQMFYYGNANQYSPNFNWVGYLSYNGNFYLGNYNNPTEASINTASNTDYRIMSGVVNDSGINRFFLEGVQKVTGTSTSVTGISSLARPIFGAWANKTQDFLTGYIGMTGYWSTLLSASLRRRFEQAAGFSFKIACS
jgi:hypothetical protein